MAVGAVVALKTKVPRDGVRLPGPVASGALSGGAGGSRCPRLCASAGRAG